jgi:medium-chain acyl-[acyl-carrier-protein] hydrolase
MVLSGDFRADFLDWFMELGAQQVNDHAVRRILNAAVGELQHLQTALACGDINAPSTAMGKQYVRDLLEGILRQQMVSAEFKDQIRHGRAPSRLRMVRRRSFPDVRDGRMRLFREFVRQPSAAEDVPQLFCFPFAGGSASFFHEWSKSVGAAMRTFGALLPGRERRASEPLANDIRTLADAFADDLRATKPSGPVAFFGHSMGALLAFETARSLRRMGGPLPDILFVSAFRAPQLPDRSPAIAQLANEDFVRELQSINGDFDAFHRSSELLDIMLPIVRADVAMCEVYEYYHEPPLPLRITAFGGDADEDVSFAELEGWRTQSIDPCASTACLLPGGHLFIRDWHMTILETIVKSLSGLR